MIWRRFDVVNRESPLSGSSAITSAGFIVGAPSCVRPVRREIDVTLNDVVVDLTAPETSFAEAPLPETPLSEDPPFDGSVSETDTADTAVDTDPTFADLPLGPALQRAVGAIASFWIGVGTV